MTFFMSKAYNSNTFMNIYFIDELTYNSLKELEFSNEEIYKLFYNSNDKVSYITYNYIRYLNNYINNFLFSLEKGYKNPEFDYIENLTDTEKKFIKEKVKSYLTSRIFEADLEKKSYDLIAFTNNTILIIVSESFLATITKCKDKFSEFILSILRYLNSLSKINYFYSKLYLNFKLNENYFTLLRSKLDL